MTRVVVFVLALGLVGTGCANPYCGASNEPCCGGECAPGLLCASGTCAGCDVFAASCSPGENCVWSALDPGFCVAAGSQGVDQPCALFSDCAVGLICTARYDPSLGGTLTYCEPPCRSQADCDTEHVCTTSYMLGRTTCVVLR